MKIEVAGGGYDSAADALTTGNQLAAGSYNALTGQLSGFGAMAGDDKTSEEFSTEYDAAARDVVPAFGDLVDAFATLGELTAASVGNHREANAKSVYLRPPPVTTSTAPTGSEAVDVPAFTPPSSLGGDDPGMPEFWNEVMDYLEGYAWPNADTGKLREAGTAWRDAATDIESLGFYCDTAKTQLGAQKSPEIPLATSAVDDLKQCVTDLAGQLRDIGDSCDDYATQVETTRETLKGILRDLAIEVGLCLAASFFTAGSALALALARIIAAARKILAALKALVVAAKAFAVARLMRVVWRIKPLRAILLRLKRGRRFGKPGTALPGRIRPPGAGRSWNGRVADNGKGDVWQKPGSVKKADSIRVMDPTPDYPHGYVRFHNGQGQPIGLDGKPSVPGGSKADNAAHTHIPRNPDGTYPVPDGWSP